MTNGWNETARLPKTLFLNAKVENVVEKMLSDPHMTEGENIVRRVGYHHYHHHHKSWSKLQAAGAFPPVLFHE